MIRLLIIFLLIAGNACGGESTIFQDNCTEASVDTTLPSHTVDVGTGWGARITMLGSPTGNIVADASSDHCVSNGSGGWGIAYEAAPIPNSDIYTVYWDYSDIGAVANNDAFGFYVNFTDADNFYACVVEDDGAGTTVYISERVSAGAPATPQAANPGDLNGQSMSCKIDYSGSDPTITFDYGTGTLTHTDTASKVPKDNAVAIFCGGFLNPLGFNCGTAQAVDNIVITIPRKSVIMMSKGEAKWQK